MDTAVLLLIATLSGITYGVNQVECNPESRRRDITKTVNFLPISFPPPTNVPIRVLYQITVIFTTAYLWVWEACCCSHACLGEWILCSNDPIWFHICCRLLSHLRHVTKVNPWIKNRVEPRVCMKYVNQRSRTAERLIALTQNFPICFERLETWLVCVLFSLPLG